MNGRNFNINPARQSGAFMVEFALIAPVFALVLVFVTDMVGKQTIKGRLQGLAYSAVSVAKERVELYGESTAAAVDNGEKMTQEEADQLYSIVTKSMGRTMVAFGEQRMGYFLEQQKFNPENNNPFDTIEFKKKIAEGGIDCLPDKKLKDMKELRIQTSWKRPVSLYQITLCYKDTNSFGNLVDEDYSLVKGSAIMLGR